MKIKRSPPEDEHELPSAGTAAFTFGSLIVVFTATLLAGATLALWVGSPPWPATVPVAALTTAFAAVVMTRRLAVGRWTIMATALAGAGLTIVLSATVGGTVLDTSFDGQWYHQEAVIRLVEGWNPIRTELAQTDVGNDTARRALNGFPKASWLWAGPLVAMTDHVEHAKALSFPLMAAAAAVTFAALFGLGRLPWWLALCTALAAAANPVAITQTLNTQLDGDLASLLLIAAASLVVFGRTGGRLGAVTLAMAIMVGVNLKLTAPAYFSILMAGGLFVLVLVGRRPIVRPLLAVLITAFIVGVGLVGFHPYVTNTLRHGHPLYPVMGPERMTIIPPAETDRVTLLFRSVFGPSHQFHQTTPVDQEFADVPLKIPITVDPSEVQVFVFPDVRGGGWGPLFGGMVLLSITAVAVAGFRDRRWIALAGAGMLTVLASVLVMPHAWFARYAPQGWLLPIIAIPVAWRAGGGITRLASVLAVVTALVNSSLVAAGYYPATIRYSALTESRLDRLRLIEPPLVLDLRPFRSNRARLAEMGIAYTEVFDTDFSLQLVLGRHQPHPTRLEAHPSVGTLEVAWDEVPEATHYRLTALLAPPAGPGGGALSVLRRSFHASPAFVPVGNGSHRVLLSSCNRVACSPPVVSRPVSITGVRRSGPLLGNPEASETVSGQSVLLSWLPATRNDPTAASEPPTTYLVEVEHATTGEVRFRETTEQIFCPAELEPGQPWIARVRVAGADPPRHSHPVGFRTAEPVVPIITRPADGASVREGDIMLGWSGVPHACAYEILVTEPDDGVFEHTLTNNTELTVQLKAKRHAATTYHAIVRAHLCDPDTGARKFWGPWSVEAGYGPARFTVEPTASRPHRLQ